MHLVFLNQYYPPDAAPTGVMLAAVVEELAAQGHEVTVICAEGGYAGARRKTQDEAGGEGLSVVGCRLSEALDDGAPHGSSSTANAWLAEGAKRHDAIDRLQTTDNRQPLPPPTTDNRQLTTAPRVLRIRATRFGRGTFLGKVVDYGSYYAGVAWKLMWLRPRPERIVALTTPPYLSVLARVCSKLRGGDHAHWVMDLYPDVMVAHGMLREGSMPHRVLAGLARWGFGGRRCAALLTLGPDMAERVGEMLSVVGCRLSADRTGGICVGRDGVAHPSHLSPTARGEKESTKNEPRDAPPPSSRTTDHGPPTTDNRIQWIPLWSDAMEERRRAHIAHRSSKDESGDHPPSTIHDPRSLRHARGWREDELVVMYSGNMGLGHRFGEILEIAVGLDCQAGPLVASGVGGGSEAHEKPEDTLQSRSAPLGTNGRAPAVTPYRAMTRFVFFGGGKRRAEIERFVAEHPDLAVELHDYAPAEDLGIHLRSADVHLASLAAEWTGTMVPSKLQGIFHAARPVIFIGDASSSIGRWVAGSGGGWVVAAGDVAGLERAIDEARDPEVRETRGRAAKAFAEVNFDKPTNVRRVAEVLAGQERFSG